MHTHKSPPIVPIECPDSQPQLSPADTSEPSSGVYQHYKGALYEVLGIAQHSESGERLVIYRALYGQFGLWARPWAMFQETVVHHGIEQARFSKLQDKPTHAQQIPHTHKPSTSS